MSTESIKMVVDMIQSLGAGGKEAFVWYLLCAEVLPYTIGFTIGMTIIIALYHLFKTILAHCMEEHAAVEYLKSLRDRHNLGNPGFLSADELRSVTKFINNAINAKENK